MGGATSPTKPMRAGTQPIIGSFLSILTGAAVPLAPIKLTQIPREMGFLDTGTTNAGAIQSAGNLDLTRPGIVLSLRILFYFSILPSSLHKYSITRLTCSP